MQTIILEKPEQFRLTETASPSGPEAGHALVQVRRIGICGTDLHAYRGRQPFFSYPRILGHELGVEVVEVGPNEQGIAAGDRCAVEPYLNCGDCVACRAGKTNCCASLQVLGVHIDGGMREQITVPVHKLHRSKTLSLEQLALVETLGIGAHAVDRAQVQRGETTLVIGAGPIGLSVVQFLQEAGAEIVVLDINEQRLRFVGRQFGVERTVLAGEDPLVAVSQSLDGAVPNVVFDATGSPQSMMLSFDHPAPGGRLVLVGLCQADITFHDPDFHRRELTVLATRNSTSADFRRIVDLMENGSIDTDPWITHRAAFDEMLEAFPSWLEPRTGVVKAMVEL